MDINIKTKIIDEIMMPLNKVGFVKYYPTEDEISWDYLKKEKNGVIQVISIYDNGFFVNMSLSLVGAGNPEYKIAELLDNGDNVMEIVCGYQYTNEDTFKQRIVMFKDFLVSKGLPFLHELSTKDLEDLPEPTSEKYELLKQIYLQSSDDTIKMSIDEICIKMNEMEKRIYNDCKREMILLAIAYGNWLISVYGGTWGEKEDRYIIYNCGKKSETDPLSIILRIWKLKYALETSSFVEENDREYH